MKTAIIMVTYNGWPVTENCLSDLENLPKENFVVAVADNGSTDNTVENIREKFPDVKVYPQEDNLGFGAANNAAFKALIADNIDFDSVCLLNNDTRFDSKAIVDLQKSLAEATEKFGKAIVVPRVKNSDGTPQANYFAKISNFQFFLNAFRSQKSAGRHLEGRPIPCKGTSFQTTYWASAVCWIMPRSAFETLGGFDENIFMYYEDWDLAHRAINEGFRFYIQDECTITHLGGASAKSSITRALQHDHSQEYVFEKHFGIRGKKLSRRFRICRSLLRFSIAKILNLFNKKYSTYVQEHKTLLKEALNGNP